MVAVRSAGVAAAIFLVSVPAIADPNLGSTTPPPSYPPVEIDVGGHVAYTWGSRCTRRATDLVACSNEGGLAGVHGGPRYRVLPFLALGVRGAVSFAGNDETWWQALLTARVLPFPRRYEPLWMGAEGGVVAIAETLESDELGPAKTLTHTAPLFALGLGVNFPVASFLTLGPEVRGFVVPFGAQDYLPDRGTSHETQLGVALGLTATVRVGGPE